MARNVVNLTVSLPSDLNERMREAGLRPTAILVRALEEALAGHDPGTLPDRVAALEKRVRGLKLKVEKLSA